MTDLEIMMMARMEEQKRLITLFVNKEPKRTHTAAKIVMTELLMEEVSWKNIRQSMKKTKKKNCNG